ncbi:16S rRNA (guanine(1207)-N(2))-methyltransferase RsmC [Zobellella aerophila]
MFQALTSVGEMLTRNFDTLCRPGLLICGQLEDSLPLAMANEGPAPQVFSTDYRYTQWLKDHNYQQLEFGSEPTDGTCDAILLLMPKAKAEAEYLLAACLPLLAEGGHIFIAGDNKGGVKSAPQLLAPYCNRVNKLDSARRASLFHGTLSRSVAPFQQADWLKNYDLPREKLQIYTLPGVFSAEHLDTGSSLLLQTLGRLQGRVLDFGCGAGVIGASLLKRQPELELEMIDINALALEASRQTLARNGLNARVYPSNGLSQVNGKFDQIITNPPFHAGLKTFYSTTEELLHGAIHYLKPGGRLTLVANAFLPYPDLIQASFGNCETLAATGKFKIYQATKS